MDYQESSFICGVLIVPAFARHSHTEPCYIWPGQGLAGKVCALWPVAQQGGRQHQHGEPVWPGPVAHMLSSRGLLCCATCHRGVRSIHSCWGCVQAKVYRCLLDIASGLAFLHQKGILHGDLKLGNILLKSTTSDIRGTCRGLPSLTVPPQAALSWLCSMAACMTDALTSVWSRVHLQDLRLWHEPPHGRHQQPRVHQQHRHRQLHAARAAVRARCASRPQGHD